MDSRNMPLLLWKKMENRKKNISNFRRTWYNIERYYTCADLRPTAERTISSANHAHPSERTMFGEHGIISKDSITKSRRKEYYE